MTEEKRMTETEIVYNDAISESKISIEKALGAFDELIDYEWDVDYLTVNDAVKCFNTPPELRETECSVSERVAFNLIKDYKRIVWLINVARDYCVSCSKELQKALDY